MTGRCFHGEPDQVTDGQVVELRLPRADFVGCGRWPRARSTGAALRSQPGASRSATGERRPQLADDAEHREEAEMTETIISHPAPSTARACSAPTSPEWHCTRPAKPPRSTPRAKPALRVAAGPGAPSATAGSPGRRRRAPRPDGRPGPRSSGRPRLTIGEPRHAAVTSRTNFFTSHRTDSPHST